MNIRTLRYLKTIEKTKSISKAAKNLFISQSALSRAVNDLENQIGFLIFQRTPKGIIPTHAGNAFIERISSILSEMDEIENTYYKKDEKNEAKLYIAIPRCSPVLTAISDFYNKSCNKKENVNIVIKEENANNVITLVANSIYPLGIIHYTNINEKQILSVTRSEKLKLRCFDDSPVSIQINKKHPLANKESIDLTDLQKYPHITYEDENIPNINYCSDIKQYNHNIVRKRIVVHELASMKDMVLNTNGYYIGCDYTKFNIPCSENLKFIPINNSNVTIKTSVIYFENHKLSLYETAFLKILEETFA